MSKNKGKGKAEEEAEDVDTEEDTDTEEESDAEDESAEDDSEDEGDDDESDEDSEDDDDSDDEESDDEDESGSSTEEDDDELDDEIEKERKAGEPDPTKAKDAFKGREKKRGAADTDDDDKPLTRGEAKKLEDRIRKETLEREAHAIAKELADGSAKQAQLILLKWKNRTFPASLTLREQMTEAFVLANSKKLIGERNEAMRGLKGKRGVKDSAAGTHRDAPRGPGEPKLPPADAASLRQSGFSWNVRTKRYEKKLPNGLLIRDNQTKQVRFQRQGK